MPATNSSKKLDLSRLTDEEAKHVWEVIQRDMELRKKEESRLGELKTKIEKEDTKRELLGVQTCLSESHCIRCLQPFKFLVNSRRQCCDCRLYVCKTCSRYSKKEHSWVCDPCRMSRVLKVSSLGWYHDNIRSRFKHFGSAKVMRSLCKRLNGERGQQTDLRDEYSDHQEEHIEPTDAQRYRGMRKTKRLLSVHPLDFEMDQIYLPRSRRQSFQVMEDHWRPGRDPEPNMEVQPRFSRRQSLDRFTRFDETPYPDNRIIRSRSLSKISPGAVHPPHRLYPARVDTSEEEDGEGYTVYQLPPRRRSRVLSQENLQQAAPHMNELSKRMSAIENLLNRLEQKMVDPVTHQPETPSAVDLEEEKLSRKLRELTGNISDKDLSTEEEEEEGERKVSGKAAQGKSGSARQLAVGREMSSSSDEELSEAQKRSSAAALCDITTGFLRTINATENALNELAPANPNDTGSLLGTDVRQADETFRELEENVYMTAGKSFGLERALRSLEQSARSNYFGHTDSELSELEDKVALAAAKVQTTESEVSDIENRIVALSAAGKSGKSRKKTSGVQKRTIPPDHK